MSNLYKNGRNPQLGDIVIVHMLKGMAWVGVVSLFYN